MPPDRVPVRAKKNRPVRGGFFGYSSNFTNQTEPSNLRRILVTQALLRSAQYESPRFMNSI